MPFLAAEPAEPPPAAEASPPVEPEAVSWQAPPPIRRRPVETASPLPVSPLAAEPPAAEPAAAPVVEPPRWQQAPPPVRQVAVPPPVVEAPATVPSARKAKETLPPSPRREPPPGRRQANETIALPSPELVQPAVAVEKKSLPPVKRNTAKRAMVVMVLFVLAVAGAGIWYGVSHEAQTEAELLEKAKEAYQGGDYVKAAAAYDLLNKNFADSDRGDEFRFLKDLCGVRRDVALFGIDADTALARLRAFAAAHKSDPLLMQYKPDVWDAYRKLIDDKLLAKDSAEKINAENYDAIFQALDKARKTEREAAQYASDGTDTPADLAQRFQTVEGALARFNLAREQLAKIDAAPPWTWEKYRELEKENKRLGVDKHPEIKGRMEKAGLAMLFESNRYFPHQKGDTLRPPTEDTAHTLLVVPRLDPPGGPQQLDADGVVFALARGVLYALRERDGHVLWFVRVGIDTATLPVRLPKSEANPRELVLVLSSDTNTLTARDAQTGAAQWQYVLGAPCLGRPVLLGNRAYVPTIDGHVHEIEIIRGHVLGEYQLSLGLSGAGARQEGTSLLYFPADRDYLYVLDVEKKRCVAMLHTGHPSGALRGDPIIVSDDGPVTPAGVKPPPRYLILGLAEGLDTTRLRAYRLPFEGVAHVPPLQNEEDEPRLRGWSWFQPFCDGEKIVLTTDAGLLGLFGINQYQNQDKPLFPLFSHEIELQGDTAPLGRAQVVHVADQNFWALARGRLQQWRMGLGSEGQKVAPVWPQSLPLGSPLHAAQVGKNGDTLFLVTQSPQRQCCLATAVEAATGTIRWQRQLGLTVRGEPLPLAGQIIALDRSGGLFAFDPDKDNPVLPPPRGETSAPASHLLPGPDKNSVYVLGRSALGKLTIRRHHLTKKNADREPHEVSLPAPLAGTPALGGGFLVLPLANGVLTRQALAAPTVGVERGLHWRAPQADAGASGHVLYLGNDDFLVTDGSTGLLRLAWPEKQVWSVKAEGTVDARILTAPLLLPDDMAPRICIADALGNLVLLDALKLKPIRRWPLEGKITAGPFRRGQRIGCIVNRRTLVWLDPDRTQPLWKYTAPGDGIVGQPRPVGDMVLVADFSGHFVALDAETGQPRGPGYTLKANVAPAATPLPFGQDGVFAPLTDGTILLLTREQWQRR